MTRLQQLQFGARVKLIVGLIYFGVACRKDGIWDRALSKFALVVWLDLLASAVDPPVHLSQKILRIAAGLGLDNRFYH